MNYKAKVASVRANYNNIGYHDHRSSNIIERENDHEINIFWHGVSRWLSSAYNILSNLKLVGEDRC